MAALSRYLLPVTGALGIERLNALYGISVDDTNLSMLMRHRAILFGLLGIFCLYSAFRPALYLAALLAGAISVSAFLYLAYSTGGYNEELHRVVVADVIAAGFLAAGFVAFFFRRSGRVA
ncbi:MAG: hypothetical protein QNJ05_07930 [Woeseiaceae bacterium]|nr:hypothetical protein [Woeseiaceae bacterium]